MSDFNYEIERTDHYFFENFTAYGKSVQNGTPTPLEPVSIEVVSDLSMPSNITWVQGGVSNSTGLIGLDTNRIHTAMFPIIPGATYTVGRANANYQYSVRLFNGNAFSRETFVYGDTVWKSADDTYINTDATYMSIVVRATSNASITPDTGSEVGLYANTDCIGLQISDTIALIDLQGNALASLPDGTRDVMTVDSAGHCIATKAINHIVSYNGESVGSVYLSTTGQLTTGAEVYYKASSTSTIDLGYIDISQLQDIETEIPITLIASLETETEYLYNNKPSYKIKNPYENADAPNVAYPPVHFGQEWETFDANDWNVSEMLDYTYQDESHAVYTVELCELMQSGVFDWKRSELDWSEAAYNTEQYERFCKYFESRFMFREICMLPPLQWFTALKRMLVYELMPKYKPLYEQIESGLAPLGENEYYKRRHITSNYPETLLSGNSDYITTGDDEEFERVKVDNAAQAMKDYRDGFASVDKAMADELEVLFISMYTSYVNGL